MLWSSLFYNPGILNQSCKYSGTAIIIDKDKILNDEGLRYPDEFVRHKLLDSLGDFSLLGMPIKGHIITHKSGHTLNHLFIKKFIENKDAWETGPAKMG